MTSTVALVWRAASLARLGLAQGEQGASDKDILFLQYDGLVAAKALLDIVMKSQAFDKEFSRYSSSLDLCTSIITRSIDSKRESLARQDPPRPEGKPPLSSPGASRCFSLGQEGVEVFPASSVEHDEGILPNSSLAKRSSVDATGPSPFSATDGESSGPSTAPPDKDDQELIPSRGGDTSGGMASIVGSEVAKRALYEHVVLPLKLSERARNVIFGGVRSCGQNVLLHGPPGTGKTSLAEAAGQEAGAGFFSVTPSSILSKYQGESERVLHTLFERAKATGPSIIFLDEVDALAPSRDGHDDVQSRRLLAELLMQTSQLRPGDRVTVIGATNRIEDVDAALLRRFHCRIFVGPPRHEERKEMVLAFLESIHHTLTQAQLASVADRTHEWSGSDIKSLCREACMGPVRSLYLEGGDLDQLAVWDGSSGPVVLRPVHMSDFEMAYAFLMNGDTMNAANEDQVQLPQEHAMTALPVDITVKEEAAPEGDEHEGAIMGQPSVHDQEVGTESETERDGDLDLPVQSNFY